ncbi:MAG: SDR family NAD(P)-dependent oxidoreductase [Deltaproteobacteria bacterium]|jgi:NADP-dependent 3-hydroxy acid dehydrogenase YdfG|nr:SDR family NAD(P)-dependent oxidoreductase [Deltaproteobacteria bacterium]MBW2499098.1 SDR family NAD(P)-dependent oxidoreductase [Deltaproteobacteria bacterium]
MTADAERQRTVLITGASAGLGEALALACARKGWRLALGARRIDRLEAVASRARDAGAVVHAAPLDVADERSVERFFVDSEAALGVADVVVNNAGFSMPRLLHESEPSEIRNEVETNLLGTLFVTRRGVAALVESGTRGDIVFMGSDASTVPRPGQATYSACKGALEALGTSLSRELEGTGVRIIRMRLGPTMSEFAADWDLSPEVLEPRTALFRRFGLRDARHFGNVMAAEDVAEAVLFAVGRPLGVVIDTIDMYPEAPLGDAVRGLR